MLKGIEEELEKLKINREGISDADARIEVLEGEINRIKEDLNKF